MDTPFLWNLLLTHTLNPLLSLFQVVLLGDSHTGKTSLVLRFVEGYYRESARSATIGAFFLTKRVTVQEMTTCKLLLWDTAGLTTFARLARTYYQSAAAAILTFDVSQPGSLIRLRGFLQEVLQNCGSDRRMIIAICACKCDLDPSLHAPGLQQEAARLAADHGCLYMKTSAKTNLNVQALFEQTAERVWQAHREATAGIGLPIQVKIGGSVSDKMKRSPENSRFKTLTPKKPEGPLIQLDSRSSSRLSQNKKRQAHKSPDDSDTANEDSVDDVVIEPEKRSSLICEGSLMSCVSEDSTKGCVIC
jgi:Ras-related protein Rab-5C